MNRSVAPFSRSLQSSTDYGALNSAPLESLLSVVSQSHDLLAQILQLSSSLPADLQSSGGKYAPILFEFQFFRDPDAHERKIEASKELTDLDEEFREGHAEDLERLYGLFHGIVDVHARLVDLLQQLQSGFYIQCSVQSLMLNLEGKQLMLEAIALIGALLLALDRQVHGVIRERAVVAYYRLKGGAQAVGTSVNQIITLTSSTGFHALAKKPPAGYPETYFGRMPLPQEAVMAVIAACRSDDIYHQVEHYPAPEHRTVALAHQAAELYLALYFVPNVLHKDPALMRTLVDRHFADNWVVAWGPGFRSDLAVEWESFKAARSALSGVVTPSRARDQAATYAAALPGLQTQLASFLLEGKLKEEFVLQHMTEVFTCLRCCNVMLRWLFLHTCSSHKKLRAAVASSAPSMQDLLAVLLDTALLEFEVRGVYGVLLESKADRWQSQRNALIESVVNLAAFYQALQALPRSTSTADLSEWFDHLIDQVQAMDFKDPNGLSRIVQSLTISVDDAERFHPPEAALQTKQYLSTIRSHLGHTLRVADVREELLATLTALADFSYGWGLLDAHLPRLQAAVRSEPGTVLKLRCLFLKMRSLLEVPLLRMGQARSPALAGTSRVYSSALVAFSRQLLQSLLEVPLLRMGQARSPALAATSRVYSSAFVAFSRRLLQVVPESLGALLDQMVVLRSQRMKPLPARIDKGSLREFAQPEQGAQLAALARRIAAFAEGMRAMEKTFVGIIELQPTKLLEEGLRARIAQRIAHAAAALLAFSNHPTPIAYPPLASALQSSLATLFIATASLTAEIPGRQDLEARLSQLAAKLAALRSSFALIQDMVDLPALSVWHAELSRVISANLAAELRRFTRIAESSAASTRGQEPSGPPAAAVAGSDVYGEPVTFIGRLVGELLRLTHPVRTQYQPSLCAWHDAKGAEVVSMRVFRTLGEALDMPGLQAVGSLLAARTAQMLRAAMRYLEDELDAGWRSSLTDMGEAPGPPSGGSEGSPGIYMDAAKAASRQLQTLGPLIAAIGQAQLLQQRTASELRSISRLAGDALLHSSLETLNAAVLSDARQARKQLEGTNSLERPGSPVTPLEPDLAQLLASAGQSNALEKVYIRPGAMPELPEILFLLLYSIHDAYTFQRRLSLLERRDVKAPDAVALSCGIATVLQQFNPSYAEVFLQSIGQCVCTYVHAATGPLAQGVQAAGIDVTLPQAVSCLVTFAQDIAVFANLPEATLQRYIPPFIADTWLLMTA